MEFHSAVGKEAKEVHKKKELGPNTCDRGLGGITASHLIQSRGMGLKHQQ